MKLLLYCTKAKNKYDRLVRDEHYGKPFYLYGAITENFESLNGKIVAECDFEVEKIRKAWGCLFGTRYYTSSLDCFDLYEKSYLSFDEINNYLKGTLNEYCGYAIHIKNLYIFDNPIDIRNYYNIAPRTMQDCMNQRALVKAPQNMCNAYDVYKNHYILISIRPEWLCKILNGEKTIEVRKKVLKEMIQDE